jgi:hypothetical protein
MKAEAHAKLQLVHKEENFLGDENLLVMPCKSYSYVSCSLQFLKLTPNSF